jgi:hypothetical protein
MLNRILFNDRKPPTSIVAYRITPPPIEYSDTCLDHPAYTLALGRSWKYEKLNFSQSDTVLGKGKFRK